MSHKISVRLPPALNDALRQAARDCGVSPSGLIRAALDQFLSSQVLTPRQHPPTAEPLAAPPPDAWKAVLARCPVDVQAKVRQAVDRTGLSLGQVIRALLITAVSGVDTPPRPS
jgi:hypothetical protein